MLDRSHDIRKKISESGLAVWEAEFLTPQSPSSLQKRVEVFSEIVKDHFVDSPRVQFGRDAWIASRFGIHRNADLVQLLRPEKDEYGKVAPDFQVRIGLNWLRYESVEVLQQGRRRSDEIREDRENDVEMRHDHIPDWNELKVTLSAIVSKKAFKSATYAQCHGLIVLLNLWVLMNHEDRFRAFVEGTACAGKVFNEVWILEDTDIHLIWSEGNVAFK